MNDPFYVVGIGASAGGLKALEEFFSHIPRNINAAFIVVMHLNRDHQSQLDLILSKFARMPARRILTGDRVEKNRIYVMPENTFLEIEDGVLKLYVRPLSAIINKSIDIFFQSLASDFQEYAVGIVLSGSGSDGAIGVKRISEAGGSVFVQNPESASFKSMPNAAIEADHPDLILNPAALAVMFEKITTHH
jgi:two-component system, chemotaxis family, protein-glutamate methylesterase/glutaminase